MKLGLAFSGGKDSWACLLLNRHRLGEITVFWVDTGKCYPELLETIAKAQAMCPDFVRIKSDREGQNARNGLPADVVPVKWTRTGQSMSGPKLVTIQPYLSCCYENIALPLHRAAVSHGITHLIRGQRNDDGHKSPSKHGDVVANGITYLHPIEDWSAEDVLHYVGKLIELPDHFRFKLSSMDCYDCTAYAADSVDRVEYMRTNHPALHKEYADKSQLIRDALTQSMAIPTIEGACHG